MAQQKFQSFFSTFKILTPFAVFLPVLAAAAFLQVAPQHRALDEQDADLQAAKKSLNGRTPEQRQRINPTQASALLYGLWAKTWPQKIGDQVRFYYFHKSDEADPTRGIGLYRYGKLGLNQTHSFTWQMRSAHQDKDASVERGVLELLFKKTGELARTAFVIEEVQGRKVLILTEDPRDKPKTSYEKELQPPPFAQLSLGEQKQKVILQKAISTAATEENDASFALKEKSSSFTEMASSHAAQNAPLAESESVSGQKNSPLPFNRMWLHIESFKEGGIEFQLYQFQKPALDGRGVGWYHRGDFDNWSTEMLTYRLSEGQIELHFSLRNEETRSSLIFEKEYGHRVLVLEQDPRNFWHRTSFVDGGQSFIAEKFPSLLH